MTLSAQRSRPHDFTLKRQSCFKAVAMCKLLSSTPKFQELQVSALVSCSHQRLSGPTIISSTVLKSCSNSAFCNSLNKALIMTKVQCKFSGLMMGVFWGTMAFNCSMT